ncbi:MAG: DUF4956 domain-containing protein [Mobilitalea sp.]
MFETIFGVASDTTLTALSISTILLGLAVALVLGLVLCTTYYYTTVKKNRSASFMMSIIILPAVVAIVILLVGGNIARAFSMAGIFTIVRFRSVPGDAKDISYIFITMAVGLSIGLGYLTLAAVLTVILGLAIVLIGFTMFGAVKEKEKRLKIAIPEDMNYEGAFDDLFTKYTDSCELQKVKTTNMGTLYELNYDLIMKTNASEKELIDAIRCRNGNLNIQLGMKESAGQQL